MVNRLNNYNPQFWARTALMWLKNRRGMYSRVYRVFENERNSYGLGDVINIRKPATFTAQDAPNSTAQDLKTGTAQINLNIHKEVKVIVTDRELAYASDRLITEHIGPMADALYDHYDQALYGLASQVPHTYDFANGTNMPAKFAAMRRVMVENKVPQGQAIHYMASPTSVERMIADSAFSQQQGAGDQGINTQRTGEIGPKYGFDIFESQNGPTLEGDAVLAPTGTLTVGGTPQKNTSTIALNTTAAQSITLHEGQVIAITDSTTGITERYAITADAAPTGNNWPTVSISPGLRRDLGAASTWALVSTVGLVGSVAEYQADLAFHRNAFASVMVPLPMHGSDLGVRMFTASDPATGLSVRARMYYAGDEAEVRVVLDALGGLATLDPDLALRPCVH